MICCFIVIQLICCYYCLNWFSWRMEVLEEAAAAVELQLLRELSRSCQTKLSRPQVMTESASESSTVEGTRALQCEQEINKDVEQELESLLERIYTHQGSNPHYLILEAIASQYNLPLTVLSLWFSVRRDQEVHSSKTNNGSRMLLSVLLQENLNPILRHQIHGWTEVATTEKELWWSSFLFSQLVHPQTLSVPLERAFHNTA